VFSPLYVTVHCNTYKFRNCAHLRHSILVMLQHQSMKFSCQRRRHFHCLGLDGYHLALGFSLDDHCLGFECYLFDLGLGTYCLGPITACANLVQTVLLIILSMKKEMTHPDTHQTLDNHSLCSFYKNYYDSNNKGDDNDSNYQSLVLLLLITDRE